MRSQFDGALLSALSADGALQHKGAAAQSSTEQHR